MCEYLTETTVSIFQTFTALDKNAYYIYIYCLPHIIMWALESHVLAVCALLCQE